MAMIHISRNREQLGQFPEGEVTEGLRTGRFLPTDLAWKEGMASWTPLAQFPGLGGQPADAPSGDVGHSAPPPGGGIAPEPAWERRGEGGSISALVESVRQILGSPGQTFAAMPIRGGLGAPLAFTVSLGWFSGTVALLYQLAISLVNPAALGEEMAGLSAMWMILMVGIFALLLPVFITIMIFISTAVTHLCLMIVGGAKEPFEATFRVGCYANGATSVLQLIPLCGSIFYSIWYLVALIIGLQRAHGIELARAIVAVLLPLIVCCGCVIVFYFVVFAAAFGGAALAE